MVKSMTGFGRGDYVGVRKKTVMEIKTVNHRYIEILVKMPRQYSFLEERIKRFILDNISRGRVEVYIKMENTKEQHRQVQVDKEIALAYYKALKELAAITDTHLDINILELASLPDVLSIEEVQENPDEIWDDLAPALDQALEMLLAMRTSEGDKLKMDLEERINVLNSSQVRVTAKSSQLVVQYREKLQNRLQELLDKSQLDESRLAMEVALLADRSDISEELVRLRSHFNQFLQILQDKNPVGRKLDFLIQEMNREVNTIGSKANDLEVTQQVVDMKSELEKVREQVQNIE